MFPKLACIGTFPGNAFHHVTNNATEIIVDNLRRYLDGKPLKSVGQKTALLDLFSFFFNMNCSSRVVRSTVSLPFVPQVHVVERLLDYLKNMESK